MSKPGPWARASIIAWVGFIALGAFWAAGSSRRESDWLGAHILVPLACGLLAASVSCIVLAAVALAKHERGAGWTLVPVVPSALLLLAIGVIYARDVSQSLSRDESQKKVASYAERIRRDPGVVLAERWYAYVDERNVALIASFSDEKVSYTDEQVRSLYGVAPQHVRDQLFRSRSCTPEFLAEHFDEAFERARTHSSSMLDSIVSNPNLPASLRAQLPKDTDGPAR